MKPTVIRTLRAIEPWPLLMSLVIMVLAATAATAADGQEFALDTFDAPSALSLPGSPNSTRTLDFPDTLNSSPGEQQATGADRYRESGPWTVSAFAGIYDDSPFLHILSMQGGNLKSSYIGGMVLGRTLGVWRDDWVWEGELQVYQHSGLQETREVNAAVALHWTRFFVE